MAGSLPLKASFTFCFTLKVCGGGAFSEPERIRTMIGDKLQITSRRALAKPPSSDNFGNFVSDLRNNKMRLMDHRPDSRIPHVTKTRMRIKTPAYSPGM